MKPRQTNSDHQFGQLHLLFQVVLGFTNSRTILFILIPKVMAHDAIYFLGREDNSWCEYNKIFVFIVMLCYFHYFYYVECLPESMKYLTRTRPQIMWQIWIIKHYHIKWSQHLCTNRKMQRRKLICWVGKLNVCGSLTETKKQRLAHQKSMSRTLLETSTSDTKTKLITMTPWELGF